MRVKWGKMAAKVTVWLAAEVLLSLVGLDHLADYGEFLGDQALSSPNSAVRVVLQTAG